MLSPDMTVQEFANWWMKEKPFNPPKHAMHYLTKIWGATLFREGQFQVQFFIGERNAAAPPHRHPNIDVVDRIVAGMAMFDSETKDHDAKKTNINIHPNEMHGSRTGRHGACFLCFQKWLNDVPPTSVDMDWVGEEPICEAHAEQLKAEVG